MHCAFSVCFRCLKGGIEGQNKRPRSFLHQCKLRICVTCLMEPRQCQALTSPKVLRNPNLPTYFNINPPAYNHSLTPSSSNPPPSPPSSPPLVAHSSACTPSVRTPPVQTIKALKAPTSEKHICPAFCQRNRV